MSVIYKDGQFYGAQSVKDIFLPVGSIIPMMSNHAPKNTLICNGTVYNIADYLQLANFFESEFGSINYFGGDGVTTFAVPDLKGEFLRGSGTNSHEDGGNGSNVGIHQGATRVPHTQTFYSGSSSNKVRHQVYANENATGASGTPVNTVSRADKWTMTGNYTGKVKASTTTVDAVSTASDSGNLADGWLVRPTNTSVLYCIVYKNIYADVKDLFTAGDGINISEESEISTDNMPSTDMSEILSPLPSVQPGRVRYSTAEQIVGTWIDGKPLYQRAFIGKTPTTANAGETFATFGTEAIYANCHLVGGYCTDGQSYRSPNSFGWDIWFNASGIRNSQSTVSWLEKDAILIVRYTKTTD